MWQDPPEPPKPKKKKTKTQIDDEGNEVIIELSEDESSDEEEKVNTIKPARNVHSTNNPISLSLSLLSSLPAPPGVAPSSHCAEHSSLLR